jgi:preprotein translocase subunit SecY
MTQTSSGNTGASGVIPSGYRELVGRMLYVLLGIIVYRVGAHIPVPGIDPLKLAHLFTQQKNTIFGLFNMFSGGALQRFTLFALGIMPYITASIVVQLFSVIHPKLAELKKEGEQGKRKINQYTRYATLGLATFHALGMARYLASAGIAIEGAPAFYFTTVVTLVTGTMLLMWLGEQMTERGVGNGISMLIFSGIVANLPTALARTFERIQDGDMLPIQAIVLFALMFAVTAFVVFIERGQRRIAVNYARRQQGRKIFAAQSSHLPLKVNMAGVIPPIFASSILLFPATISHFFSQGGTGWLASMSLMLSPGQPLYMALMVFAIIFFCFFYTALVFNPVETADNLKKSGALLPGIRPGQQTALYIDKVMTRLTLFGAAYLTGVSLVPELLIYGWQVPFYFGGTSLLIIVVVVMDFWAQIQAHLMSQQYASLMKKANLKGLSLR